MNIQRQIARSHPTTFIAKNKKTGKHQEITAYQVSILDPSNPKKRKIINPDTTLYTHAQARAITKAIRSKWDFTNQPLQASLQIASQALQDLQKSQEKKRRFKKALKSIKK